MNNPSLSDRLVFTQDAGAHLQDVANLYDLVLVEFEQRLGVSSRVVGWITAFNGRRKQVVLSSWDPKLAPVEEASPFALPTGEVNADCPYGMAIEKYYIFPSPAYRRTRGGLEFIGDSLLRLANPGDLVLLYWGDTPEETDKRLSAGWVKELIPERESEGFCDEAKVVLSSCDPKKAKFRPASEVTIGLLGEGKFHIVPVTSYRP